MTAWFPIAILSTALTVVAAQSQLDTLYSSHADILKRLDKPESHRDYLPLRIVCMVHMVIHVFSRSRFPINFPIPHALALSAPFYLYIHLSTIFFMLVLWVWHSGVSGLRGVSRVNTPTLVCLDSRTYEGFLGSEGCVLKILMRSAYVGCELTTVRLHLQSCPPPPIVSFDKDKEGYNVW